MSEFRHDPLSRRWVIIGGERGGRPNEFVEAASRASGISCPFCAGHESETPEAIATYSSNGKGKWLVRVVPNKYPAVTPLPLGEGGGRRPPGEGGQSIPKPSPASLRSVRPRQSVVPAPGGRGNSSNGTRSVPTTLPGFGSHEVIVESPRHIASFSELTDAEAAAVFSAYSDRLQKLKAAGAYRYVQIFKNVGPAAGASLEHVHSQLVALPSVPEVIEQELAASGEFFQQHNKSLLADMIEREVAAGDRIVAQTDNFVAFCPYASRFGYEVWLAPRRHQPRFEDAQKGELGEASRLARDIIGRIERAAGQSAYNYFLHTQPFDMPAYDHYHWHIEITPRLTKVAGFEWGTGCFINPYPPEAAAEHLRSV
jgi:UDPglucose--hexose-1-phosphate uridylyltransferase